MLIKEEAINSTIYYFLSREFKFLEDVSINLEIFFDVKLFFIDTNIFFRDDKTKKCLQALTFDML